MIAKETNRLFPVFLKMEELKLLIIGGGNVALEKLHAVINNSPATKILLIATHVSEAIQQLARQHDNLLLVERPFENADLANADVVIVAINNQEVSASIREAAKQLGKLVNVADTPAQCDFYLGSIVTKGQLKIAISTNGKSPTIAKRLKENFNEILPPEMESVLENMQQIRNRLKGDFTAKVVELNKITQSLAVGETEAKSKPKHAIAVLPAILIALVFLLIGTLIGAAFL